MSKNALSNICSSVDRWAAPLPNRYLNTLDTIRLWVSNRRSGTPGAARLEKKMRYASPDDWNPESDDPRDKMMHGVQVAFGRIYAGGAFGEFPNESLEVARQAAFALVDHVYGGRRRDA